MQCPHLLETPEQLKGFSLKLLLSILFMVGLYVVPIVASPTVSSPQNGVVSSPTKFVATAGPTTCSKGVSAIGVYVDNMLAYKVDGKVISASLSMTSGVHSVVVQQWDYCGGADKTAVALTVVAPSTVSVALPAPNSETGWLTTFSATAMSPCPAGVSAMGIYVNDQLLYVVNGAQINTQMNLSPGKRHTVVTMWDGCGGWHRHLLT